MVRIECLKLGFGTMLLRYYLMMAIVVAAGFSGSWLLGILALPVFISTLLGMTLKFGKAEKATAVSHLPKNDKRLHAA
ncbi:MAG: hypothetical protein AB8F74_00560 [Saprospiraceae bacterium]